jgi:hypothetical protein
LKKLFDFAFGLAAWVLGAVEATVVVGVVVVVTGWVVVDAAKTGIGVAGSVVVAGVRFVEG